MHTPYLYDEGPDPLLGRSPAHAYVSRLCPRKAADWHAQPSRKVLGYMERWMQIGKRSTEKCCSK